MRGLRSMMDRWSGPGRRQLGQRGILTRQLVYLEKLEKGGGGKGKRGRSLSRQRAKVALEGGTHSDRGRPGPVGQQQVGGCGRLRLEWSAGTPGV